MAVTVNTSVTAASVSSSKPRVSFAVVTPNAEVQYVLPASAVQYILLQVGAELDTTGRYKFIPEVVAVLDSKVMSIAKMLATTATIGERFGIQFSRPASDLFSVSDSAKIVLNIIRKFSDAFGTSDSSTINILKNISESILINENRSLVFAKLINDGFAMNDGADVADGVLYAFTKSIINVAFTSDFQYLTVLKNLFDTVSTQSTSTFYVEKILNDSSITNEHIETATSLLKYDSYSLSDAIAQALDKHILGDSASVTDFVSKDPDKGLSDASTISSSGSLLSQNYCDITYFAEDYVGESRTFT